jgi:para-nitrobenzyl esterase
MAGPAILMAWLQAACGGSSPPPEERKTTLGTVVGIDDTAGSGTYVWKGIPYARPPVGELRWRAPVAPAPWATALAAQRFGGACIQNGRIFGPGSNNTFDATIGTTLNTPVGSEDCLTLNIWRPANDGANLPVIVFAYGGSNISGYSADPVYDGAALAKAANAVVVTLNYRLGVLGFFNLPQLRTGADAANDSGNFALLDIQQSLRFVKDNIGAFGGNAGNVTLMGQSAGAINIWTLLAAPSSRGLFHKAVPLSGGASLAAGLPPGSIPTLNPASTYLNQANALLGYLLVADGIVADLPAATAHVAGMSAAQVASYMRGKSAQTLISTVVARGINSSGPVLDGTFLPVDPIAAIAAGNYNKVPVLAGNTAEEGKLFARLLPLLGGPSGFRISDAALFTAMTTFNPDAAPTLAIGDIIDAAYLPVDTPTTGFNARTGLIGNAFLIGARNHALNTLLTQQPNIWFYEFKWAQEAAPWNQIYGAAHAFDLPFLFGNFGPSLFGSVIGGTANQGGRLALSKTMMASIAAFARNGDPNHAGLGTTWQPWPRTLVFDASPTQALITTR